MSIKSAVNDNSSIYYKKQYWNDIPQVYRYMCKNFTNDEKVWWVEDFKKRYAKKPFKNALFINCGNGRIEREFIDKKIVLKATAFDYSQELLDKAEKLKGKRGISYFQADANTVTFKKNTFDLVVNVAGLHHVQYINRFVNQLARSLTRNGLMVNFDYIGPHRNQYSTNHWKLANAINHTLHPKLKHPQLLYPSVPVMLQEDPTEAIHSELIIETIARYFNIQEKHDTGGGLAYLLFTHNINIFKNLKSRNVRREIEKILNLDRNLSLLGKIPQMFSYFIATPKSKEANLMFNFEKYQKAENLRELTAFQFGLIYRIIDVVMVFLFYVKNYIKVLLKKIVRYLISS